VLEVSIYLADEHPIVRLGIKALLQSEPSFQVVGEADDGQVALRQVERLKPDVLLVEVMLRGLNGLSLAQRLQKRSPSTRVIFFTMYSDEAFVVEAFKNHALGYVLKLSDPQNLIQAIREALLNRRFLCPNISQRALSNYTKKANSAPFDLYDTLSPREREVMQLAAEGLSAAEIGKRLHISPRTSEMHRANLMRKLGLRRPAELIRYALRRGLMSMD
jgi:DNA-binding NarL/FixJ family response regulator